MRTHIVSCLFIGALLSGCTTMSRLALPDGRQRVPANTQPAINEYLASISTPIIESRPTIIEPAASVTQLEAVRRDVEDIRRQLASLMADQTDRHRNKGRSMRRARTAQSATATPDAVRQIRLPSTNVKPAGAPAQENP